MGKTGADGASILVTGGTGTFGQCFVRTLLEDSALERIVVFSRDELKQHEMQKALADHPNFGRLRFFIGDVRDRDRLELATRGLDCIVHAAALKQIPTAEYNPFECIHTNVIGAENIVNAAIRNGIDRVVALSTDKAVNPVNLYGASKLAAEKIFVAANHLSGGGGPVFSGVRYGNVLGSRGSIIPYFRDLVEKGADRIPITDTRMTRFWITIPQAVDFVRSCLERMQGGEIFVPKIPSMNIVDLAEAVAPDVAHEHIGIRPGEKLHEVMVTPAEARTTLEMEDRFVIEPAFAWWARESYTACGALPVPEGFSYSSDQNHQWLGVDELRTLLG